MNQTRAQRFPNDFQKHRHTQKEVDFALVVVNTSAAQTSVVAQRPSAVATVGFDFSDVTPFEATELDPPLAVWFLLLNSIAIPDSIPNGIGRRLGSVL